MTSDAPITDRTRKALGDSLRQAYPIDDRLPDWFFRLGEVANNVYRAEGIDLRGRTSTVVDTNDRRALDRCVEEARRTVAVG